MALGTTEHHAPPPQQHPSPGVGVQGAQPVAAPVPPPKPVLFDDIDPVLLVRLYPESKDAAAMRAQALAAGAQAAEQGAAAVASQNEPVLIEGMPPPPPQPRSGPGPQREA
jgi:hypothetical protein